MIEIEGKKITAKQYAREVMLAHLDKLWDLRAKLIPELFDKMTNKEAEEGERHLSLDETRVKKILKKTVDKE